MTTIIQHHEGPSVIRACPQCRVSPTMELFGKLWEIGCRRHGHLAMGNSADMVVSHWNKYIAFITHEAAEDIMANGVAPAEFSFCVYCKKQTRSIPKMSPGQYEIECAVCHLIKNSGNKKEAHS